jgi:3-deoxy-D-manno-octulosonic-acid transferase
MISFAYAGFASLASPFLKRMLKRRGKRGKEVPERLGERFGIAGAARPAGRLLWFHAASVGETLSVLPVIEALEGQASVLLTTGTVTSAELAAKRLPAFALHQFAPLDVPGWVRRFLDHWRPDGAIFVESELWPATLALLDRRAIPRLLINGSMSARSAARWRRLPGYASRLLGGFKAVHAQSGADAANLTALGAKPVLEWGNLKFAAPLLPVDEAALRALRMAISGASWLAASTHPGEEAIVIAAHRRLLQAFPALVTVIAPRHPARGAEIAALAAGLPVARRSLSQTPAPGGIYIADTIGGHNLTEPARLGTAVLTGPFTGEIAEQVQRLQAANAMIEVSDAAALAQAVQFWLEDPLAAAEAGGRALQAFDGMQDLPKRLAALILENCA